MSQPYNPPPGQPPYPPPGPPYPPPDQPYYPPAGPPPRPPKRHWLRNTLLLIITALVVAFVIFAVNRAPTRAPETKEVQTAGRLSAFDLQEGDCYNTTQAPPPTGTTQPISSVEAVPCTSPHTDQVIAKITYTNENYFDVVGGKADKDCLEQFKQKLDSATLKDPALQKGTLSPADIQTWITYNTVACIVSSDTPISRSLLGG